MWCTKDRYWNTIRRCNRFMFRPYILQTSVPLFSTTSCRSTQVTTGGEEDRGRRLTPVYVGVRVCLPENICSSRKPQGFLIINSPLLRLTLISDSYSLRELVSLKKVGENPEVFLVSRVTIYTLRGASDRFLCHLRSHPVRYRVLL